MVETVKVYIKVLQIANGYLKKSLYRNLFEELDKYTNDTVFVPIRYGDNIDIDGKRENIVVRECFSQFDRLVFYKKQINILKEAEKSLDIDSFNVIHAHTVFSNGYLAYKLKKKYGIPYVVSVRNTDLYVFFEKIIFMRKIGLQILENAGAIVFLSEAYKAELINKYVPVAKRKDIESKCVFIPNGVDNSFLENKVCKKKLDKEVTLLHIGDIDKNKNLIETVRAVKILKAKGYNISFRAVGEVKDKRVEKKIKDNNVEVCPKCTLKETLKYYQDSHILVMPSHHETFGIVYVEAMSQGLPIVYTRGQGFDGQYPDGEIGYSVNDNKPNELAYVIEQIMKDYENISERCIKNSKRYSWQLIAKNYFKIYERIMNNA